MLAPVALLATGPAPSPPARAATSIRVVVVLPLVPLTRATRRPAVSVASRMGSRARPTRPAGDRAAPPPERPRQPVGEPEGRDGGGGPQGRLRGQRRRPTTGWRPVTPGSGAGQLLLGGDPLDPGLVREEVHDGRHQRRRVGHGVGQPQGDRWADRHGHPGRVEGEHGRHLGRAGPHLLGAPQARWGPPARRSRRPAAPRRCGRSAPGRRRPRPGGWCPGGGR